MATTIQPEPRQSKALPTPPSRQNTTNPFRKNISIPNTTPNLQVRPPSSHNDFVFLPDSEPLFAPESASEGPTIFVDDLAIDEEEHQRAVAELKALRAKCSIQKINNSQQGEPHPQEQTTENVDVVLTPISPETSSPRSPTEHLGVPARPTASPNVGPTRASLCLDGVANAQNQNESQSSFRRLSPRKNSSAFFQKHNKYEPVDGIPLWEETLMNYTIEQFNIQFPLPKLELSFEKFPARRHKIVNEFFHTEQTYVRTLQTLVALFEPVLAAFFKEDDHPTLRETLVPVFKTVKDILGVNTRLHDNLYDRLTIWSETQKIGDVLFKLTPFLKIYQMYTSAYEEASSALKEAEAKSKSWKEIMEKLSAHPITKTQSFSGFLIQPVQRIPRYVLLLTDLIKETPTDHPDYEALCASLTEMKQVAVSINEAISAAENRARCLKIQHLFGNTFEIVSPHRKFITEGTLMKQCRKEIKERRFFIFSDILVYGFEAPGIERLIGSQVLKPVAYRDVPDSGAHSNAIQIVSSTKSFNIYCQNSADKEKWMKIFTETLAAEQHRTQTLKGNQGVVETAPVWVPDEEITECPLCHAEFTFLFRRHHCRSCGTVVCKHCSDNKVFLPHVNKKNKERVCDDCFKKAQGPKK